MAFDYFYQFIHAPVRGIYKYEDKGVQWADGVPEGFEIKAKLVKPDFEVEYVFDEELYKVFVKIRWDQFV